VLEPGAGVGSHRLTVDESAAHRQDGAVSSRVRHPRAARWFHWYEVRNTREAIVAGRFTTVEEYLDALPEETRAAMEAVRRSIHAVVPTIGETISYSMPTFTLDGLPLLHVAAWKKHIGLYPLPPLEGALADDVAPYRAAKDALRLPLGREIPSGLVERVVAVMVAQRSAQDTGS
jgi:uncharacterized protein YdhG (YjbR/CyaY superfamily)